MDRPKTQALTKRPEVPVALPALLERAGPNAQEHFLEYFAVRIRNKNTRTAYMHAVGRFLNWCEGRNIGDLREITPMAVAAYIEQHPGSAPTVKQHLAALRMCFDWLVTAHVLERNPAHSVKGPSHSVKKGKTPVLTAEETKRLLESIELVRKDGSPCPLGLRDRALIGLMVHSFARISAALGMHVEDFFAERGLKWFRLHEKGGKRHEVPAHHKAVEFLEAYLAFAGISGARGTPLFRAVARNQREYTDRRLTASVVWRMIGRRALVVGLPAGVCCHTFRATGITAYLQGGGSLENAQQIAGHAEPQTTKLYDRRNDELTADEIERIHIY